MFNKIKQNFNKHLPIIYNIMGGFIIVAGWNWYHLAHKPHFRFILISSLMWAGLIFGFWLFKLLYKKLLKKFGKISFWHKEFNESINELYFIFSLFFLVFFSTNEILSLVYLSGLLFRTRKFVKESGISKKKILQNIRILI